MSTVRSTELTSGKRKPSAHAPLSRSELMRAAPWLRGIIGIVLIAYSALATVDGVRVDCGPLCAGAIDGLPLSIPLWIPLGILVAAGLSVGQWITAAERVWIAYLGLLAADARYSQWWLDDWIAPLAAYHTRNSPLAWGVGFVVSWGLAILVALLGEFLLFGWRKQSRDNGDD